ncbi:MAG: translocation/assembly module TamB domain-containing protein [Gemmatimonadota bacterium]
MARRKAIVMVSAGILLAFGAIVAISIALATRTEWGREQIRSYVEGILNESMRGKVHLGRISGTLFTGITVDSFSLAEPDDSLFIATGQITVSFDPRDLIDRRILVRQMSIARPVVRIREDSTGTWNLRKLFPPGPSRPRTTRGFGDYVVVRNATIRDGDIELTSRWRPADSLSGTRRDSSIAHALARPDKRITRSGSHFVLTRAWTGVNIDLTSGRIATPDSAGRSFHFTRLDANEFDPPLDITDARGSIRLLGDSLWADITSFELPGSRGSGTAHVVWGSGLPNRYDVRIRGDTVSMADVAWVYPTLPTTGGGRMDLAIRNKRSDLDVIEFIITNMDVRSMNSRLAGAMTFGVGGPVLEVRDVDLRATPVDWILIERLTGEPLPYPWKGTISAVLRARGGPVNRWRIDSTSFVLNDANVPGAGGRGRARGELDILFPAFTRFRAFDVEIDHLDLATLQFLEESFPRLDGAISGRATLDSVWTDVRFHSADITHRFGDNPPSRFTGSGRATLGDEFITWDVALDAQPLDLTTTGKAWPELELTQRGEFRGSLRAEGTAADLALSFALRGAAGDYAWDGRVDIDSVGGYTWDGTLRFANADLRTLYDTSTILSTRLTGAAVVNITGDSVENYRGTIDLRLDRSSVDSMRVYEDSRTRLVFDDGILRIVDTLKVTSELGSLLAWGGVGLRADRTDSLSARLETDSLGALRPYWVRRAGADTAAVRVASEDTLDGRVSLRVALVGSVDTLAASIAGQVVGLHAGNARAAAVRLEAALANLTSGATSGTISVTADTATLGATTFARASLEARAFNRDSADVQVAAVLANGPSIDATATTSFHADTTRVLLTEARLNVADNEWSLERRSAIVTSDSGWSAEGVSLRDRRTGARLIIDGQVPSRGQIALALKADSVALEDLAAMAQSTARWRGQLSLDVNATGTASEPVITFAGALDGTAVGDVSLSRTTIAGRYADRWLQGSVAMVRNDTTILDGTATISLDLALEPRSRRVLDDTMRVTLRSRDVDLGILESFTSSVQNTRGRLNADVAVVGLQGATTMQGFVRIDDGQALVPEAGVTLRQVAVLIEADNDTARIRRFRMTSGPAATDTLGLSGWIAREDRNEVAFDLNLTTSNFEAVNTRRAGRISVSSDIRQQGRTSGSVLGGRIFVNSGEIVIPELSQKKILALSVDQFAGFDTALVANRQILPKAPPAIARNLSVRNLQVEMGPDVWMRSVEANIKLGGRVNVINATGLTSGGSAQLALEGSLQTERGTFNLRIADPFVQRLFTLEGGEVRFLGDPDFNPDLDIRALYVVRQASSLYRTSNDVRIRARLLGTLVQPRIVIESGDSLALSESDLFSYLITGRPSAEIGGLQSYGFDFLLATVSSGLSARYSGRYFDFLRLQTASSRVEQGLTGGQNRGLLEGAQLGVGKQLNERTFISLTAGLCRIVNPGAGRLDESIGLTLENRLPAGYGLSISKEPPVEALLCQDPTSQGFSAGRSQTGIDLFRSWRW